jgi:hypothetical protein
VNIEDGLTLSAASVCQRETRGTTFLFRVPEDTHVLDSLLANVVKPTDELYFSFDVIGGYIAGGNFSMDGEVVVIIHPGTWGWRY